MTCSLLLDSIPDLVFLDRVILARYISSRACALEEQGYTPNYKPNSNAINVSVRPSEHSPALGIHAARRALRLAGDNGVPSSLVKRNRKGLSTSRRSPLVGWLGAVRRPR